ncbi:MAG: HmuY family protein [Siphonobacter sp.]
MNHLLCCFLLAVSLTTFGQEIKTVSYLDASQKPTYFNLQSGKSLTEEEAKTSSWDIALQKTTISVNSGTSGSGHVQAQVIATAFDQLTKAPIDGYKSDSDQSKAIPTGSGNGWYKYNSEDHSITPLPGKVILIKSESGAVYKLDIQDYYSKDGSASGVYSFRYALLN